MENSVTKPTIAQVRDWVQDTREQDFVQKFVRHNLVHKTKFVESNLKFAKQITKTQPSEFDDRIGMVHRICKSQFRHKTEFVSHNLVHKTEFVSHNLVHKTEFVSHNLVHKTEFVDNNLKFAYEMTMEFND